MIIERFSNSINGLLSSSDTAIGAIVGVIAFSLLYFYLIAFLSKNKSGFFIFIFVISMLISAVIITAFTAMNSAIFLIVPALFLVLTAILYSVEFKRLIYFRSGFKTEAKHSERSKKDQELISVCIDEIVKAIQNMSKNDVGAIIVLSNGQFPKTIIDSGVSLNSEISSELIESVFFPKTPLHDGAMIIDYTKVMACGCFLPLTQNIENIPKDLGTRHRAGIGVTETIDVISIIVSEETGIISVAKAGKITRFVNTDILRKILTKYYWQD